MQASSHVVSSTSIFELGDWYCVLVSQHLFWLRVQTSVHVVSTSILAGRIQLECIFNKHFSVFL